MKVSSYPELIALWTEYEMGEAKNIKPKGLRKGQQIVGLSLPAQGHRAVEARAGYSLVYPDLQEKYNTIFDGVPPHRPDRLDPWEAEFAADLLVNPILLVPPGPPPAKVTELSEEDRAWLDEQNAEIEGALRDRRRRVA